MLPWFPVTYLPRPDAERTAQDVDEIYALTTEALQRAATPAERVRAFRTGLLRAYEAGVDAQRELERDYEHDRPTPVPAPPAAAADDPGTLPPGPKPTRAPGGVWKGGKKR
jgi:hypothetical protein